MNIPFYKYQGTGNDFILIDQRTHLYLRKDILADRSFIRFLCDRHFGIGADGLILLQEKEGFDFEMVYFNSDGNESSMCGNGGRCITAFAARLGLVEKEAHFLAIDGPHDAKIKGDWIELRMINVNEVEQCGSNYILNTGSPHYVHMVSDLGSVDLVADAREIRYNDRFAQEGINVNFVSWNKENGIDVLTYERGVEGETLSCGTGVTASSIAMAIATGATNGHFEIPVNARGGNLLVKFDLINSRATDVWLCGPATFVFKGTFTRQ